jgi:hypothetical protein
LNHLLKEDFIVEEGYKAGSLENCTQPAIVITVNKQILKIFISFPALSYASGFQTRQDNGQLSQKPLKMS